MAQKHEMYHALIGQDINS